MHNQAGIPLPVRAQLDGEKGTEPLRFNQHSSFAMLTRHTRGKESRFRHNSLIATSAYEPATYKEGMKLGLLEAKWHTRD